MDVGIRVNDFVEFISPKHDVDAYKQKAANFIKANNLREIKENISENLSFVNARSLLISYGIK
jgi:hypothetical protein